MFEKIEKFTPQILGATRGLFGVMLACHGAQKVLGFFGGVPLGTPAFIIWVAGSIELVAGGLIAVGLFTRGAAFLASGVMAAAYFMGHAPRGFWPIANGGELAIIYCWFSLYLAARGPGAWAVDGLLRGRTDLERSLAS